MMELTSERQGQLLDCILDLGALLLDCGAEQAHSDDMSPEKRIFFAPCANSARLCDVAALRRWFIRLPIYA